MRKMANNTTVYVGIDIFLVLVGGTKRTRSDRAYRKGEAEDVAHLDCSVVLIHVRLEFERSRYVKWRS